VAYAYLYTLARPRSTFHQRRRITAAYGDAEDVNASPSTRLSLDGPVRRLRPPARGRHSAGLFRSRYPPSAARCRSDGFHRSGSSSSIGVSGAASSLSSTSVRYATGSTPERLQQAVIV
jgi:hypothetical protein